MSLYEDLLKLGKDAIDDLTRPLKVRKEKNHLEKIILDLESQINTDELTIQQEKSTNPIKWDKLTAALDSKCLSDRRLKQLQELQQELFGKV